MSFYIQQVVKRFPDLWGASEQFLDFRNVPWESTFVIDYGKVIVIYQEEEKRMSLLVEWPFWQKWITLHDVSVIIFDMIWHMYQYNIVIPKGRIVLFEVTQNHLHAFSQFIHLHSLGANGDIFDISINVNI